MKEEAIKVRTTEARLEALANQIELFSMWETETPETRDAYARCAEWIREELRVSAAEVGSL
jgi:hypothetical protein